MTDGAAMWLFHYFIKKASSAALCILLTLEPTRFARSTDDAHELPGSYLQVVSFLLATYVTNDGITETVKVISPLRQERGTAAADLAQTLYDKVLRCGNVYLESHSKMISFQGLAQTVCDHMRVY